MLYFATNMVVSETFFSVARWQSRKNQQTKQEPDDHMAKGHGEAEGAGGECTTLCAKRRKPKLHHFLTKTLSYCEQLFDRLLRV